MRFAAVVAVGVVLLSACGGGGSAKPDADVIVPTDDAPMMEIDAPPGAPDFTLSVSPTSVTGPIGSSMTFAVTVTRSNNPGAIALTARDLPTGVTVSFDPASLTNVNSSVATVTFNAGTAPGAGTFTVVGTAGTLERTAQVSTTAQNITVTGTVRIGGNVASGLTIGLVGKTSTTSDANGNFTFTDVTPPYDLYTVSQGFGFPGPTYIYYYKGLMRTDPQVVATSGFLIVSQVSSATVSGTLSNVPGWPNQHIVFDAGGSSTFASNGTYSFTASWPQAATRNGTLYALAWSSKPAGTPDLYRYGSLATSLAANTPKPSQNFQIANVATATITGTLTPPATFGAPDIKFRQALGPNNSVQLYTATATGTLDVTIPVIAAGKTTLYAQTAANGATSAMDYPELVADTDASFTMAEPATLVAPAAAATGVTTSTDFTFTAPANTVNVVSFSTSGTVYVVYTHATTARIPNVSQAPLPAAAAFSWSVQGYAPYSHVDEVARVGHPVYPSDYRQTGTRATYTATASRSFTSQ